MALPVVRTRDEAHLYMDLHPCQRCQSLDIAWESGLTDDEGAPARRYHGVCRGCQAPRERDHLERRWRNFADEMEDRFRDL